MEFLFLLQRLFTFNIFLKNQLMKLKKIGITDENDPVCLLYFIQSYIAPPHMFLDLY